MKSKGGISAIFPAVDIVKIQREGPLIADLSVNSVNSYTSVRPFLFGVNLNSGI
jgi:hypothetical protein